MPLCHSIGSSEVSSTSVEVFLSRNPSRPEDVVAEVPVGSAEDVDAAVRAASDAFPLWRSTPGPARADALYAWAAQIAGRADDLAAAIVREVGKPIGEAKGEVARCVAILRYNAGEAVRAEGEVVPALAHGPLQYAVRRPLGVVGLLTPWNFPLAIPLWKAAPALAMGNTVVLKPSEHSGLCGDLLAKTADCLPPGVFNVVHGTGAGSGNHLVNHHLVKALSFTGSVRVGTHIATECAARNAKCQTEMGGKNAAVVLEDADLVRAAGLVAGGAMRFAGQKCTATSRVIVDKTVLEPFVEELSKAVQALPVGDPSDPATAVGPVIDEPAQSRLNSILDSSTVPVLYRSQDRCPGFSVAPSVLGPVDPGDALAQDELFGPVLALIVAEGLDDAVEKANATRFGLSTAVYTRDLAKAMAFVDRVEAGLVRVNGDTTGVDPHAPFGGTKASSSGTREQGAVGKEFFTEWKTVQLNP